MKEVTPLNPTPIQRAVMMAELLVAAEREVERVAELLQQAKENKRVLEQEDLPQLMKELELTAFSLEDGSSVTIRDEVDASITQDKAPAAHAWLIKNGFAGLIKCSVVTEFERGDQVRASQLAESLVKRMGPDAVTLKNAVHAAALKSWVKEQRAAGQAIPDELFGVFPYSVAKVTPPKAKKSKAK